MHIGKPERRFVVRIIDLSTNKSRNFSIYDGNEKATLDEIHDKIMKLASKSLGLKK